MQTREDGVLNKSVVPKLSETTDKLTSPARARKLGAGDGEAGQWFPESYDKLQQFTAF